MNNKQNNQMYKFEGEIKQNSGSTTAYIEIPADIKSALGKGRTPVSATFDGEPYKGQLVKTGTPCYAINIRKDIRSKIDKGAGDTVIVTLTERSIASPDYTTIDEYIALYDGDVRIRMEKMRELILSCSEEITEKISWAMPTFILNGNLVHFSAQKHHLGFHPAPSAIIAFSDQLQEYKHSKGTVQFPYAKPMPYDLIREIVMFRINEQTSL